MAHIEPDIPFQIRQHVFGIPDQFTRFPAMLFCFLDMPLERHDVTIVVDAFPDLLVVEYRPDLIFGNV